MQVSFRYIRPLGTFLTHWTLRYLMDTMDLMNLLETLNLQESFEYVGPLGYFLIPWNAMYLLDTLYIQVPFRYLGPQVVFIYLNPLCTFLIHWTFKYILDTLDLQVRFGYLDPLLSSHNERLFVSCMLDFCIYSFLWTLTWSWNALISKVVLNKFISKFPIYINFWSHG